MMDEFLENIIEDTEEFPEEVPEEVPAASPDPVEEESLIQEEEIEETLVDDPVVSGNEIYQQEIINLLKDMKGDLEDVKRSNDRFLQESQYIGIYNGLSVNNVPDDQSEYLSSNIITKPINDYTVSEALLLIEVVVIFGVIIFLAIRKAVFKWR